MWSIYSLGWFCLYHSFSFESWPLSISVLCIQVCLFESDKAVSCQERAEQRADRIFLWERFVRYYSQIQLFFCREWNSSWVNFKVHYTDLKIAVYLHLETEPYHVFDFQEAEKNRCRINQSNKWKTLTQAMWQWDLFHFFMSRHIKPACFRLTIMSGRWCWPQVQDRLQTH